MALAEAWRAAPLAQREAHDEALTLTATRLLRAGKAREAFAFIDRRCRTGHKPKAPELAIRALTLGLLGWPDEAAADIALALAADPLDPFVALTRLRLAQGPDEARLAAEQLAFCHNPPVEALRSALAMLMPGSDRALAHLDVVDDRLSGWVAFPKTRSCVLEIIGADRTERVDLLPEAAFPYSGDGVSGHFVDRPLGFRPSACRVLSGNATLADVRLWPRSRAVAERPSGPGGQAPAVIPPRAALTIVVPIYADFDATRACLVSAAREAAGSGDIRLVVVDDASPDREIRLLLDALAARGTIELIRNDVNLGFVGAVQRGMEGAEGRDVLLLNADTVLPSGALRRLCDAVYSAPGIGTATPLSNNGEYTSFPRHGTANPSPDAQEAHRIDAIAARVNAGRVIDLPNGVGFCLYVRYDCNAAVGGLSGIYRRGYFEDVEFCLRARRAGFRNVCAPDVFVVHHGTLSFKAEKRALVTGNLAILRSRFPGIEAECAAYGKADPLRQARAALEAELAPAGRPILIAAAEGSAVADERTRRHCALERRVVRLSWARVGERMRVRLRGTGGAAPQSLDFDLGSDAEHLACYLMEMAPMGVEVAGCPPPSELVEAIVGAGALPDILVGDFSVADVRMGAGPPMLHALDRWREALPGGGGRAIALDGASLSAIHARGDVATYAEDGAERAAAQPLQGMPSLGIIMPAPSPEADAFVAGLSAAMRSRMPEAAIVVLGQALDDLSLMGRANVFVTGRIDPDEIARTAAQYGAAALVLPPTCPHLALFERVALTSSLPAAFVDWSCGARTAPPATLFLERDALVRDHCAQIVDWFADRFAAPTPDQRGRNADA